MGSETIRTFNVNDEWNVMTSGILQRIVNTDNAGTITVYDSVTGSGTRLATIDGTKTIGTLEFNAPFSDGLTVVTTNGVDATFIYE